MDHDDTPAFGYEDDDDEPAPAPPPPDDEESAPAPRVSAMGKYAHLLGTSEDFRRAKQDEIGLEDGNWRPADGDEDYSGSSRAPIDEDEELPDV